MEKGSKLSLPCTIKEPSAVPQYVLWFHNGKVLNYDTGAASVAITTDLDNVELSPAVAGPTNFGGGFASLPAIPTGKSRSPLAVSDSAEVRKAATVVPAAKGGSTLEKGVVTLLHIGHVGRANSGNYTCQPSNAKAASVVVHIVDGEC